MVRLLSSSVATGSQKRADGGRSTRAGLGLAACGALAAARRVSCWYWTLVRQDDLLPLARGLVDGDRGLQRRHAPFAAREDRAVLDNRVVHLVHLGHAGGLGPR